ARKPSTWSVIAATPKTIAAGQLCAWSEARTSPTKTGMSASRTSVSAFGSCASGAGTARVAIRLQGYVRAVPGVGVAEQHGECPILAAFAAVRPQPTAG